MDNLTKEMLTNSKHIALMLYGFKNHKIGDYVELVKDNALVYSHTLSNYKLDGMCLPPAMFVLLAGKSFDDLEHLRNDSIKHQMIIVENIVNHYKDLLKDLEDEPTGKGLEFETWDELHQHKNALMGSLLKDSKVYIELKQTLETPLKEYRVGE